MAIVDEDVARVRQATELVELAKAHTTLRRIGRNYVGICPFHAEKSPSFNVNPEVQRFICFACGVRGDAIDYVCQIEHIDHDDAVELLADRAGVTVRAVDR